MCTAGSEPRHIGLYRKDDNLKHETAGPFQEVNNRVVNITAGCLATQERAGQKEMV